MTYYSLADSFEDMTPENQAFEFWVFIEGAINIGNVLSVIVFLMIRTFERVKLSIEPDNETFDHR